MLILAEVQRRIRRGSLLLIDVCRQYDAQMIIATHSEEVARSVYEHELILLDDVFGWRKGQ